MSQRIADRGGFFRSLLSIAVGLILAAVLMQISGYDFREAFSSLGSGATGLQSGLPSGPNELKIGVTPFVGTLNLYRLAQSLARVTPLLFAGLSIALGLRAGLFNIGAQGQMAVGALAAAIVGRLGSEAGPNGNLPTWFQIPLVLTAGAAAGAVWGAIPGILKAFRGVHEVISTIMLNYVALNFATYLVTHNLKDTHSKSMAAQTGLMVKSAWLSPLVPNSNLTAGILLAVLAAFGLSFLIRKTALGYEIRAVGLGAEAARAAGIPVAQVTIKTMALAGALAGIAGAVEVMGIHHRFFRDAVGSYGFDGIAVALLGGLGGGGVALSALFFGMLANGAAFMQLQTEVPDSIAVIVQAVVIVFVGIRVHRSQIAGKIAAAVTDSDDAETAANVV